MSSTQKNYSSLLSVDIMETAFLMSSSSYSPNNSSFLEMNSISTSNSVSSMQKVKDGLLALKTAESFLNDGKDDLPVSCDGAASFCKTPAQPCTFDLSSLSSANNSTANSMEDAFCENKSSTPCKAEKLSKLTESVLKSSEMNDLSVFKTPPPPPIWEISGIQATLNNTISLEASLEEAGSLAAVKPDTLSLDVSHGAVPLADSGAGAAKLPVLPL